MTPPPAEAGSKRFSSALSAVKKAVQDLERAADGTFAKLANHRPEFDVTPLTRATTETQKLNTALSATTRASDKAAADMRRVMLAADASIRQADTSALKLGYRLGDLGDTAGMAKLESALARLKDRPCRPCRLDGGQDGPERLRKRACGYQQCRYGGGIRQGQPCPARARTGTGRTSRRDPTAPRWMPCGLNSTRSMLRPSNTKPPLTVSRWPKRKA